MTSMHVDDIRKALRQMPFVPFKIRLVDGRVLTVKHPDFVAVTRRNLIVVDADTDDITWVDPNLTVSLDFPPAMAAAPNAPEGPNGPPPAASP